MFWWRKRAAAPQPRFIVFGLGNPGVNYVRTRHNVGWWVLDELARQASSVKSAAKHHGQVDYCHLGEVPTALVKPTTFMNRSGRCVNAWVHAYPAADFIVVYDDISLPVGKLRLRRKGSAGGHKGIQSIIDVLHTEDFDRLKMGIGTPPEYMDASDYVLTPPAPREEDQLATAIQRAVPVLQFLATGDYEQALTLLARTTES